MHEVGLLRAAVAELVTLTGDRPPRQVRVAIGPGVHLDAAEMAWQQAAAGTAIEQAAVVWEEAFDVLRCLDCGTLYRGWKLDRCPGCAGDGLVVEPAPELALEDWS
jgi:hydrogenase nickel incorporation protein HypA/HybF